MYKMDVCWSAIALEALQEAAEQLLMSLFEDSNLCTIQRRETPLWIEKSDTLGTSTLNPPFEVFCISS